MGKLILWIITFVFVINFTNSFVVFIFSFIPGTGPVLDGFVCDDRPSESRGIEDIRVYAFEPSPPCLCVMYRRNDTHFHPWYTDHFVEIRGELENGEYLREFYEYEEWAPLDENGFLRMLISDDNITIYLNNSHAVWYYPLSFINILGDFDLQCSTDLNEMFTIPQDIEETTTAEPVPTTEDQEPRENSSNKKNKKPTNHDTLIITCCSIISAGIALGLSVCVIVRVRRRITTRRDRQNNQPVSNESMNEDVKSNGLFSGFVAKSALRDQKEEKVEKVEVMDLKDIPDQTDEHDYESSDFSASGSPPPYCNMYDKYNTQPDAIYDEIQDL